MRTHTQTLLCITPIVAVVMAAAWAADPPVASTPPAAQASGNEQMASCLLKITADPAIFPMEPAILQYLLATSGVQQDAIKEIIGEDANVEVTLELVGGGGVTAPSRPMGFGGGGGGGMMGVGGGRGGPMGPGGGAPMPGPAGGGTPPGAYGPGMRGGGFGGGGGAPAAPVELPDSTEQMLMGHLTIVSQERGHAREIMTAVTKRLQAALENVGTEEKSRLGRDLVASAKQAEEARQRVDQLQKTRQEMLGATPFNDLSRDSVLEMSRKFETERQEAAVKIESLRARSQAMKERLAVEGNRAEEAAAMRQAQAAKAQELRARMKELEEKQQQLKAKSELLKDASEQLKERTKQLEETAAALFQLEATFAAQQPTGAMGELNDQMGMLSIDLAETEARLKTLGAKCQEMRDLLIKADDYELQIGLELPLAKSIYESARMRKSSLELRLSAIHPPTVTVIGG